MYHSRRFWQGPESHNVTSGGRSPSQLANGRSVTWSIRHTVLRVRLPLPHSAEHWGISRKHMYINHCHIYILIWFPICSVIFALNTHTHTHTTSVLPVGSRGRWTSCVHRLPDHSSVVFLALGSCYTPHPPPHRPGCSHTPPPCCAGPPHKALNTGRQRVGERGVRGNREANVVLFLVHCCIYHIVITHVISYSHIQNQWHKGPGVCAEGGPGAALKTQWPPQVPPNYHNIWLYGCLPHER